MKTRVKETAGKIVDDLRERRAARNALRQLREELSTYSTPNEIADLLAAVTRLGAPEDDQVRRILEHNLVERSHSRLAS